MFGILPPPKRDPVDAFAPTDLAAKPKVSQSAPPAGAAPAGQPDAAATNAVDPHTLLKLFGIFAPTDETAPAPAADPKAAAKRAQLVDSMTDMVQRSAANGVPKEASLASLDPDLRKEVEHKLAVHEQEERDNITVRAALTFDNQGYGHEAMLAGLDPAKRKELEDRIAEHEKLDHLSAIQRGLASQGVPPEARFAGMDPALRKEIEHHMAVEDLTSATQGKFNEQKVTELLEKLDDPDERARVLADYEKETGTTLHHDIVANTDADSHVRKATDQLLSSERIDAERKLAALSPAERKEKHDWACEQARKLAGELSKSSPDKRLVFDTLAAAKDPADTEAIRKAFNEVCPEMTGLFKAIDHSMSGDNEREAMADLDMGPKRRLDRAAAAMRNAFTGRFHDNDRARMKEELSKLTPAEIQELKDNPDQYGDIIADVQATMHGVDKEIVDAYVEGHHDLAEGRQLAEDIGGNLSHLAHSADCDKLDMKPLFAKIEKMQKDDPASCQKAIDAFNADLRTKYIEEGKDPKDAPTLSSMMDKRFDDYDRARGDALLANDLVGAKAAEAEDAIDRKGTHIDDLEESLSDPDLSSTNPKKREEASKRRELILKRIEGFGKGSLIDQVNDEDKLQQGKDNRAAFDDIMSTGSVSFSMKMQRAIDDDNTEKAKELMLHATDAELAEARRRFPTFQDQKNFDEAVRHEWGPTKLAMNDDGVLTEVDDPSGDKSGTYIQMEAVLQNGSRAKWSPKLRARTDKEAYDADRDDPSMDELTGKSWAGKHLDYTIREEVKAAEEGVVGEEFAFRAENTEAASEAYGAQKEAETESFIESLKMLVNIATMLVAPELLPLITPLMSAVSIGYKESKLGKHYKGENADKKGLLIDAAMSVTSVAGEAFIAAREASAVKSGMSEIGAIESEVNEAKAVVTEGEHAAGGEAAHEASATATEGATGVTEANEAADEAGAAGREANAAEVEAKNAENVAKESKDGASEAAAAGKEGSAEAKEAESAEAELAEKTKEIKERAKAKAEKETLAFGAVKVAGEGVARGKAEGKSWDDILKGVFLGEISLGAEHVAGEALGGALDKKEFFAEGKNRALHGAVVSVGKAGATLPFDAAAEGASSFGDVAGVFAKNAAGKVAESAHSTFVKSSHHGGGEGEVDEKAAAAALPREESELHEPAGQHAEEPEAHAAATPAHQQREEHAETPVTTPAQKEALDDLHLLANVAKSQNDGVLSVEVARDLQRRAAELGIPASEVPKASTPEEVLLARGMTKEELELYKSSLDTDGQSNIGDDEVKTMAAKMNYGDDNRRDLVHKDDPGQQRKAMTLEQLDAVLKANCLLYEDFVQGASITKVIPGYKVGELLHGKTVYQGKLVPSVLSGDVALARNTEGQSGEEKVGYVGLDYQTQGEHPYVAGEGAHKEVRADVKERLFQVEKRLEGDNVDAAKVVLGIDMHDHALMEARRLARLKKDDPSVHIPPLLELDENGNLLHIAEPRIRDNAESPSTGKGYTASMGLRDKDGNIFFRPNQELTLTQTQSYSAGDELVTVDARGERKVVAVYDEETHAFEPADGLSDAEKAEFEGMKQKQAKYVDDTMKGKP